MIKNMITNFRYFRSRDAGDKDLQAAFETVRAALTATQAKLGEQARAAVQPVRHTIKITPAD